MAPRSYNKFGGWNEGPRFEATGHFRVQKVDGKWWFIDPMGHLFWSFGCTGIGYQPVRIAMPGKAHFYEGLPALDDPEFGDLYQMNRRIGFEPSDYQGANAFWVGTIFCGRSMAKAIVKFSRAGRCAARVLGD